MKEKYKKLYKKVNEFIIQIEKNAEKPLYELTPDEARDFLEKLQEKDYKEIPADISDMDIETPLQGSVPVRFIRPQNTLNEKLPLIIYIHGGGWIMGSAKTHDELARKLAINTHSCVAFIKYTLSPEAAFPEPLNQVYAVLDYLYNNPDEYNLDTKRTILAGDSAGANMALAAAIKAKNENGAKILFQVLLYPAIDSRMETKSYERYKNGPWLTKKAMKWFWSAYIQNKEQFKDFYAVPACAEIQDLKDLPPALIITAENDVLRDEGEKLARKLDEADVEVGCVRILGTCHDFMMLNALSDTAPSIIAENLVFSVLNNVLKK